MTQTHYDFLKASINISLARSQWWIAYANTPHNLARRVEVGLHELNSAQLIQDAMQTADKHLENAQAMIERIG